ncbi:MAG: hypothetical protein AB1656_06440 [Candidatus Omnitrophota bacterium]
MRNKKAISLFLVIVLCAAFGGLQALILRKRADFRVEEKILMLSNRPKITRMLSLGFRGALSDLLWIRAIQYFGGNFSTLDKPEKKPGMVNLFRNMVGLDSQFIEAYKFGGFVFNEAMRDKNLAMEFLLDGADKNVSNPLAWRLRFDAGFIAFYQLKDFAVAKQLFMQTIYGDNLAHEAQVKAEGLKEGFFADSIVDGDPYSEAKMEASSASVSLAFDRSKAIGRVNLQTRSAEELSFQLSYAVDIQSAASQAIPSITTPGFYDLDPPITAQSLLYGPFQTTAPDGLISVSEIEVYGPPNKEVPTYVERMAIEMDRNAGRFRASFEQYYRYWDEARKKGDMVSADLAWEKLTAIYSAKCIELLEEAVKLYKEKEGVLPSTHMRELFEMGYLQQVLKKKNAEDSNFDADVMAVLTARTKNIGEILTTFDLQNPQPHLLIATKNADGNEDWMIVPRTELMNEQFLKLETLQKAVNKYKDEHGSFPQQLSDLSRESWFSSAAEVFEDPLGGEFFMDPLTGKVEARHPKY